MNLVVKSFIVAIWVWANHAYAADVPPQGASTASDQNGVYESTISRWQSYGDVANWLNSNFNFDHGRLNNILARTRQSGPSGLLAREAYKTFETRTGYCTDAAAFAIDALNRVNPNYKAQYIFIRNRMGQPHHWVAGFWVNGKIMVMDYGASSEWWAMKGVHGPYESLDHYRDFLGSLRIPKFIPDSVQWLEFPGQRD